MHPDHHAKIIAISASIIVVIVLILGLTIVVYKRQKTEPAPTQNPAQINEYHSWTESTTANGSTAVDDAKMRELNQSTTASESGASTGREAYVQATSQTN